jgi:hypothetical protein
MLFCGMPELQLVCAPTQINHAVPSTLCSLKHMLATLLIVLLLTILSQLVVAQVLLRKCNSSRERSLWKRPLTLLGSALAAAAAAASTPWSGSRLHAYRWYSNNVQLQCCSAALKGQLTAVRLPLHAADM